MAEKWTNTSSPVERWINPYPFAPLNHFTVPFSLLTLTPFASFSELVLFRSAEGCLTQVSETGKLKTLTLLQQSKRLRYQPTCRRERHKFADTAALNLSDT